MPFCLDPAILAYQSAREQLRSQFLESLDPETYLHAHAQALDTCIQALSHTFLDPQKIALAAVGGYGRKELYPYSDIDLLILTHEDSEQTPEDKAQLEAFITNLWNIGLSVGASVRTPTSFLEEAELDVSVATTYLEQRWLFGDKALLKAATETFKDRLNARHFFRDKMLERERRHQRFEDTPYALEPNVKESPGGLRDLHVFLWCAKAARLADNLEGMVKAELISEEERETLERCHRALERYRIGLHLIAKRHEDRSLFDLQESLAEMLRLEHNDKERLSEVLMREYYRNAKALTQVCNIEIQTLQERLFGHRVSEPIALDDIFLARGDELDIVDEKAFERDPHGLLRAFYWVNTEVQLSRFSTKLMRALWHGATLFIDDAFRADPVNKATFLSIIKMPKGVYQALERMYAFGILERFLPEFQPTVGQMQHDLYHIFTVDQHTIQTLRNVRHFARSEYAHEYPLCSAIMANYPYPWVITLAALFHDIGKGRGGNHAQLGAMEAEAFAKRFNLIPEETELLVFLVREHLLMSKVAQKEDISDPEVIARFASQVKDRRHLDGLYCLTVADIRATSLKVWTPWKAELLESLYHASVNYLQNASSKSDDVIFENTLSARRREAATYLEGKVEPAYREALWKRMDVVYLMRHSAREIAWHTEVLSQYLKAIKAHPEAPIRPCVACREAPVEGYEIMLSLPDQKDVFLKAVAFLGSLRLSVMDARIHTSADLSLIHISEPTRPY